MIGASLEVTVPHVQLSIRVQPSQLLRSAIRLLDAICQSIRSIKSARGEDDHYSKGARHCVGWAGGLLASY